MGNSSHLEHFGVKGMKWGVRRAERARMRSSSDATTAAKVNMKAKKAKSTRVLSNKELQAAITRMNLERQYSSLQPPSPGSAAARFVGNILLSVGRQEATKLVSGYASEKLKKG